MLKKLLFTLISAVFMFNANAAQMANVEYIHQLIKQEHNIDIKYAPDLISPRQAANMKYLLTAVDVANEILNGEKTTDYGNGEFATRVAVDTTATIQAVRTLIKQENQFIIHTTPDTQTFGFDLRARGNFVIDWGDGTVQTVNKEWADNTWNWHEYATAGEYTIKLTGLATAYSENSWDPVVKFWENKNIARLSGSLGKIFPTMDSGRSPSFNESFIGCSNLTEIPENLFRGIATTTEAMFRKTFDGCSGLTEIPENLFAGFKTFTPYMFNSTFAGCTGLTEIPAGLFAKLSGEPKRSLFDGTFYGCTGLTEIPDGLFASVTGAPAEYMFGYTFMNCTGLSGEIPGDLFAGITGAPAEHMFHSTFEGCRGLTGIGDGLFSGIVGAPAAYMFNATFHSCSGLSELPDGLFAGISGNPADWMFGYAFYGCSGLNGIPLDTFGEFTNEWASSGMFDRTFAECTNMIGESGKSGDKYLYEIWPDAMTFAYENASGLLDYAEIPTNWGGPINYAFTMTTTPDTQDFGFTINAAGVFYVDWGDGYVDTIDKSWTGDWWVSHWYETPGEYEIKLGGRASWYETWYNADISFESNQNLAKIDGSLGAIFPTINGSQPRFQNTFAYCYNLSGEIPSELFDGIAGELTNGMFYQTFYDCMNLTGDVPMVNGLKLYENWPNATFDQVGDMFGGDTNLNNYSEIPMIWGGPVQYVFTATTTDDTTYFEFTINAAGKFYVDWGDGNIEKVDKNWTGEQTISHSYNNAGAHEIKLGGKASWYDGNMAISFFKNLNLAKIDGSLGQIFSTLSDGTQPQFGSTWGRGTFQGCTNLTGEIPAELFSGISGAPAYGMFFRTFYGCSGLSGSIPESLFAGITGAPAEDMFNQTFVRCSGLSGSIPENLFAGITGAPAIRMFDSTFSGCSNLSGNIPANLFAGITGAPEADMFWQTFSGCSNLSGSIPENLFAGLSGAPSSSMFQGTFYGCSGLSGSIPEKLFAGIKGAPASDMFSYTFAGCSNLSGNIPENLFAGIIGAPAEYMFSSTFNGCSGLSGNIPENLFAGIKGAPASVMFSGTFIGCSGLTGEIPEKLFAGITGAPANSMFSVTFYDCSNLSGSIPENLFAGIKGAPAYGMFENTFYGCSGLSGSIPEKLFAGVSGAPAEYMFQGMFGGCSGLTGYIPPELFAGISTDTTASEQMSYVFSGTGLDTTCPSGTVQYTTGFESWFSGRVSCEPFVFEPKFTATTTADTTTFSFDISAAGRFLVDWGDGSDVQVITRTSTSNETYTHTYNTAGEYQIKIDGKATGYGDYAAISFYDNKNLAKIDGSLGQIFSTLSNGTQPRFGSTSNYHGTFEGCANLTGEIPADLFSGISGAPAYAMFYRTFEGCSGLSGSIPENLFAGIKGAPASSMFYRTFFGCSNLTGSIPENLFAGIEGAPANGMFRETFDGCSGLSGNIPENLFAGVSGAPAYAMFEYTFYGCSGLTGSIPENLFAGITGAPASAMFGETFSGCSGLSGSIPENLFAGIKGAPAELMFVYTFDDCSNLSGSIPENLFAGVKGAPASNMFQNTFSNCSGLTGSIPENLFAGITGAPASAMFGHTFEGCSGLTGSIPANLFAGITGAPATSMFNNTFRDCSGLSGNIPGNLFAGITGAPARWMFYDTFNGCSGLTGSIPENLFAGVSGAPAEDMFYGTFSGCSGLTGYIPPELFAGIGTDTTATDQMSSVFYNTGLDYTCPSGTVQYTTGFESWFNGKVSCMVFEPKFTATTTPDTTTFSFAIQASGEFFVDWGDGAVEQIVKDDTSQQTYSHTYSTANEYTIKMGGQATGYKTPSSPYPSTSFSTLYFPTASNIAKIDGSLGEIFGTLPDGKNPLFIYTFQNAQFTTIPETLFHGITTASKGYGYNYYGMFFGSELTTIPENLFAHTNDFSFQFMFASCDKLTSIPEKLFATITESANDMFSGTFEGCTKLTSIPETLFASITKPADSMFASTFRYCTGLTSIPQKLFATIHGAPTMQLFQATFKGCTGLTGYIPPELFAGISTDTTAQNQMQEVFYNTGLDTTCPVGTIQYMTGFEDWFKGKVSCQPI